MRLKKDDMVVVIAGNDRGKEGKVLAINGDRILVQGVQIRKKHQKATERNKKGSIVSFEAPIHISNVKYSVGGKGMKLRARTVEGKKEIFVSGKGHEEQVIRKI